MGKFVYLHSDGQVGAILGDLIEIGLDVYNPLGPAHSVMADVPVENMVAMIETVQEQ